MTSRAPICLFVAAALLSARVAGAPESAPVVLLPVFTVTDSPVAPDREAWRITESAGYEILSEVSDSRTAELAEYLAHFSGAIRRIFPGLRRTRPPETRVILCRRRDLFERFIPKDVSAAIDPIAVNRLFFAGPRRETIVLFVGEVQGARGFEVDLAHDYLQRRLETAYPPLPVWFIEGSTQIFGALNATSWSSRETLEVGKVAQPMGVVGSVAGSGLPPSEVGENLAIPVGVARILRGDVVPSDSELLGFKTYFSDSKRPIPTLASLFAGPPEKEYADWSQGCVLFVHFCLFGRQKAYAQDLQRYFDALPPAPGVDSESLFKSAFGKTYHQMDEVLTNYNAIGDYRSMQFYLPPRNGPAQPPQIRDATDGEIACIKAEAYLSGNFPDAARAELVAAYRREAAALNVETGLLASLGSFQADQGDVSRAVSLLEAAVARKYAGAEPYARLASLRLAGFAPEHRLSAAETVRCLGPLFAGLTAAGVDAELCRLIAETWARSAVAPSRRQLEILNIGLKTYPEDSDLAYQTCLALERGGFASDVRSVAAREERFGDAQTRARFAPLAAASPGS